MCSHVLGDCDWSHPNFTIERPRRNFSASTRKGKSESSEELCVCRISNISTEVMVQECVYACVVVVVVDSHIQRIVLATEETTVTQQVSHRPIKRQSRLWSQRGTKVNGSHHGDNPLLRPTGIQIATKSYAALQAMAPTNIKTVHQTSLLHSRATSIDSECCRLPTTSVLSKKPEKLRSNQF